MAYFDFQWTDEIVAHLEEHGVYEYLDETTIVPFSAYEVRRPGE
jgi:hypothetical protein